MPRVRPRSLRLRLTLVVTLAVGLALTVASFVLVNSMSNTLFGGMAESAAAQVDKVAEAVERGQPLPPEDPASATMILVEDQAGKVVASVPQTGQQAVEGRPVPVERARATGAAEGRPPAEDFEIVPARQVSTPQGEVRTVRAISRSGQITQSIDLVVNSLLVAAPVLTIFVGWLTWFAVDRALRPIEAVRRRAEAISHSTLDERLPEQDTGDEVGKLTSTLNRMLDRIASGARRQREFVSDASHELRTPLAAMRAELEVSLAHRDSADWRNVATRLLDDHRRLERLTGDLLTLARLDEAAVSRRAEPVHLDEIVAGEITAVRHAEVRPSLTPVVVTGVVPELVRLVRNLLDNADKHASGVVEVSLSVDARHALFTVDDDGPGVPPDQRERVFDRFFRVDGSRDRASGGVGLGLALVRRIARSHGGEVTVTASPSLGGARFEVRLPRN
ncbi:cell wall metabolism sensor histidine kinase WalK [Amycolatopsis sp. 195334CR]|uniref:sensor histidine kinase n=1 Tax=Amycolatopsis sp. 195334CR TaxID=2814588 RepID=UPI001A8C1FC3|nr:HAMP domain-containing sensor histidine kinase [Amycolatopsis sp. 195334CR]MBN6037082.1 HAMP domain-containing histidine kinase [Amycolatopsis sp. 195334CR]